MYIHQHIYRSTYIGYPLVGFYGISTLEGYLILLIYIYIYIYIYIAKLFNGGAHGVMVIVTGNGHDDTISNPG